MSYIGQAALKNSELKRFDVTSSTSATHVLSWTAPNEQSLFVTINGVKQQEDAYSIAGSPTTITLTDALVATDKMEVIGVLDIGVITIVGDNTVSTAKLGANAVTTAKLGDSSVTLAKLSTTGTAVAGNYLDGTMAWSAIVAGNITTANSFFQNWNTIDTNTTSTFATTINAAIIGPITVTGSYVWTISGILNIL